VPLGELLRRRQSVRAYADAPLTLPQLSSLVWASSGIRPGGGEFAFRTAPSAGALYPVETYIVANHVQRVAPGIYHYAVPAHALEQLAAGDFRRAVVEAAMGQRMCGQAPAVFIWTVIPGRATWRYGNRAYRYVYLDAGHMAQNLALAAVALGLGSCQVAALYDDEINALVGVDGAAETVIYMSVVGVPAGE